MYSEDQAALMRGRYFSFRSIYFMLRIGFGVVFALVVFSTISSLQISARRTHLREWVTHSYTVKTQIQRAVGVLHNGEAIEREAILRLALPDAAHSNRSSSVPLPQILAEVDTLIRLTRDNPRQQERLTALRPLAKTGQMRLMHTLEQCRTAPKQDLARYAEFANDATNAAVLRALNEIDRDEEHLLQQRLDALNRFALNSESLLLYVRIVALVAITLVYAGVSRIAREKDELVVQLGETNRRLETLAITDHLTGIHNQRAFHKKVEEAFEVALATGKCGTLSLIVLDIDNFKQYNDTYGHPAGDEVLITVGRLLRHSIRKSDFAARNGGEEFAILLPDTDADGAMKAAEGIRLLIESQSWPLRPITASIGVATMRPEMAFSDALTCAADLALYTSKRNGRNQVHHFDEFNDAEESPLPAEEE